MALVIANRVQETGTANTTVSFTLTGAIQGFQTFAAIGNTNTTYYAATDASGNWEVGLGTYSTTGPTLTRTTVYASSNSGSAVTFSGTCNIFVTYPSGRAVYEDASGNVSPLGTIASATWNATTIGVAYGGTGVTTSSGANSVMLRDANQNVAVNRLNQSNTSTAAAGTTTALTAASSYSQTLTGTGGQTFTMPDATTLTTGVAFVFNNNATGTVTLQDYAAGSIGTITSGGAVELVLLSNGTTAGTWDVHGYLPEAVTWGTNALNLGTTVITNGTWNGGTIPTGYGGTGLTTFTAANNALYSTSGSALAAGTLPVAAGGTGVTSSTGTVAVVLSNSPTLVTPILGTPQSGNFSTGTFTWPTFNQNTTGTAANITASSNSTLTTLSVLSLPGSQVSGDISGNSANVTGTVAVANGGTGLTTTPANGALDIGNGTGFTRSTLTAGTGVTITNASGSITIASSVTPVTSVTGTSPVVSSGGTTPAISLATAYGDTLNPYASKTANYFLAAPNGTAGAPTFRAVVAADIPTLNQNTTGSAATLTTGRTLAITGDLAYTSPSFDGSANVTAAGTLATVNTNVGSFTNATLTVNGKGLITAASSGTAPVTSVTGTSPVASSGGATPAISLASGYGDTLNPYASKTANFVLAAPNGSAGVPTFRAVVAADIPTLNQSTTGSAATLTTPRAIYGNNFDGSAALTQIIAATYGGTGNGFTAFSGPTTATKTFTLPDASSTIVVQGGALGTPSSGTLTNCTFPTLNQNTTGSSGSCTGNAATVTNGFYTTSSFNLGTTSIAVNRASASQSLTGINIDGSSGSCTGNAATATTATTATTANATNTANNFQMNSLGVGTAGSGTAGEIRATNNITAYYSDIRLKTKVGDITDPLGKVRQIETMLYHANETAVALGYDASVIEVGLSAQSVQAVQPEAVAPAPIDDKYLTVRYERLVPLLLESVKALEDRIIELEAKLKG